MADYPLKQEAAEVQEILDGAFLSNKGQTFSEETKAFMREKMGASAVGEGLKIISHFDSLGELEAAVPNPNAGDAFSVGTEVPYNLYVFDFYNVTWRNYGPIRANDIKARFAQNIPVSVGAWEEDDEVFTDYIYKAKITLSEVTGNDFPIVAFAPLEATSGNFCPIAFAFDGYVEIWAKSIPATSITIPAATFIVQDATDTVTGNNTRGITNASGGIATGGITGAMIADGSLGTAKYADKSVTRAKLANDALYSPVRSIGNVTNRPITKDDFGIFLTNTGTSATATTVYTLSDDVAMAAPNNCEIPIVWCNGNYPVEIVLGQNTRSGFLGDTGWVGGRRYRITEKFGMVVLKMIVKNTSTNNTYWLVTGNVEVVS